MAAQRRETCTDCGDAAYLPVLFWYFAPGTYAAPGSDDNRGNCPGHAGGSFSAARDGFTVLRLFPQICCTATLARSPEMAKLYAYDISA
jgi:hypothetical protein